MRSPIKNNSQQRKQKRTAGNNETEAMLIEIDIITSCGCMTTITIAIDRTMRCYFFEISGRVGNSNFE